jgi:colanic acid/amylovoran biosynthesis glycosyltransferase
VPHDELVSAYYDHHLLLAPSVTASDGDVEGGAPVTLIEAQATGLPVVSTFHCDIPEVVVDGKTGLLAPERDVSELARHLLILDRHSERLSEMGAAGRRHVEANYNASRQGSKLAQRYRSLLP